ncbi:MAG: MarR family transcriptional regulator [Deltaproteobacteria bacterium]|nr:MarR family transcriptional regulator [Deltaproteobacteria bacterium]
MAAINGPCGCKEIAAATGIDSKSLSCRLKSLKTKGYIDSPARCRYEITPEGKAVL